MAAKEFDLHRQSLRPADVVRIHPSDDGGSRLFGGGAERGGHAAMIPTDDLQPPVAPRAFFEETRRLVSRAVVDGDNLESIETLLEETREACGQERGGVVARE
jgi:hypothetical protein